MGSGSNQVFHHFGGISSYFLLQPWDRKLVGISTMGHRWQEKNLTGVKTPQKVLP